MNYEYLIKNSPQNELKKYIKICYCICNVSNKSGLTHITPQRLQGLIYFTNDAIVIIITSYSTIIRIITLL